MKKRNMIIPIMLCFMIAASGCTIKNSSVTDEQLDVSQIKDLGSDVDVPELVACPCPLTYSDMGDTDSSGNPIPWHVSSYDCNDMADMLEMKALYEIDGYSVSGPWKSPNPETFKCDYYLWICPAGETQ